MDKYRVMQVGCDFIIFADDVGVLKCQTERDAQNVIGVALDLLEYPDEWWNVLSQRLAASKAARSSGNATETAA
jgi:hypothetical protein